ESTRSRPAFVFRRSRSFSRAMRTSGRISSWAKAMAMRRRATIGPQGAEISSADRQRFDNHNDLLGRVSSIQTLYSDLSAFGASALRGLRLRMGKTSIRGSWGIFYDRVIGGATIDPNSTTPGFAQSALACVQLASATPRRQMGAPGGFNTPTRYNS